MCVWIKKTLTTFFGPVSCMEEMPCFFRYSSILSSSIESTGTLLHSFWNSDIESSYTWRAGHIILTNQTSQTWMKCIIWVLQNTSDIDLIQQTFHFTVEVKLPESSSKPNWFSLCTCSTSPNSTEIWQKHYSLSCRQRQYKACCTPNMDHK